MLYSKNKLYYVYRITHINENKHYYGYRGILENIQPKDDLGVKYFSSSTDKSFKREQKINPENFKYKIIRENLSNRGALDLEIKLHKKFNVDKNINFYNLAKQTNTGFSFIGPYSGQHNGKAVVINRTTGKRERVDVGYDQTLYSGNTAGTVKVIIGSITSCVSKKEFKERSLCGVNTGKVVALNTTTGKKELIEKKLFDADNNYVGHSTGCKRTEETRAILSQKKKGNKNGAGNRGKKQSLEHIANVIAAKKRNRAFREKALLRNHPQ